MEINIYRCTINVKLTANSLTCLSRCQDHEHKWLCKGQDNKDKQVVAYCICTFVSLAYFVTYYSFSRFNTE